MKVCLFWKYPTVWPLPHGIWAELGPVPSHLLWLLGCHIYSFATTLLSHLWWVHLDRPRSEGVRVWAESECQLFTFMVVVKGLMAIKNEERCDLVPNPFPFAGWIANETETDGLLMTMCESNNSPDQEEIFIDLWLWLFGLMLWPQIMIYSGSRDKLRMPSARTRVWGRREIPLISRICVFQYFSTLCLNDHRYRISLKVKVFKWFFSFFSSKRIAIKGLWIHLTLYFFFSSLKCSERGKSRRKEWKGVFCTINSLLPSIGRY